MTKKIRVAMVILEYHPIIGGAQRQLGLLAPYLKALDIEMFVLTRRFPGLESYENIEGAPVYRMPAQGPKAIASASYTASSLMLLKRLKPDIIHAHSLFSPLTTAITYKGLSRTPVLVKVLRGGELGDVIRLKGKFLGKQRIDIFRRFTDAFIAISQEIDTELESLNVEAGKRFRIPNGVETQHFHPVSADIKQYLRATLGLPEGPLAVFTGRLVAEKQVDVLLRAWPAVREQTPQATLLIVGEGGQAEMLHSLAGEGVVFIGGVDDVQPYLQAADVFVLPSSTEGLSNSLLEAMAAGLAVVATSVGGAPDIIKDHINGRLVRPNDVDAIQRALTELLLDPDCRQQLGAQARQTILDGYSLPVVAEQLRKLYEAILEGRP
jgi:glycosyltransferase involved in cell wall biosynthesis